MNNPIIQFSGNLKFTYLALSDENKGRIQEEKEVKAAQLAIFKGILKGLFAQNFAQFEKVLYLGSWTRNLNSCLILTVVRSEKSNLVRARKVQNMGTNRLGPLGRALFFNFMTFLYGPSINVCP